jgi:hypothetical protein
MKIAMIAAALLALVHGQGQLKLESKSVAAGAALHMTGVKFAKNEALDVLLAGPSGRVQLKHILTDSAGAFHDFVVIPEGTAVGAYRIVLVASDDDEVGQADFEIAGGTGQSGDHHAGEMAGHDMASMGGASAEPLVLPRARSPWVTGGAFLTIALALGIGATAVLRSRTS